MSAEICEVCHKSGQLRCSQCKLAFYCSKGCQLKHFKSGHKKACQDESQLARRLAEEETMIRAMHHPFDPFESSEGSFGGVLPGTQDYVDLARTYLATLDNLCTVPALRKLINHMKRLQILSMEDRSLVPYKLHVHLLQLPDKDTLQHCYNLIHFYATHRPDDTSLLPDYENLGYNMFDEPPRGLMASGVDLGHCVAFALIKIKMYVELKRFMQQLDAVLVQRDGKWNNSVILANILPFIWPSQHYLSLPYIGTAVGAARGSVGALRTLLRRLRGQIGVLLPRIAQSCRADIWRAMVFTPYAEVRLRVMGAATMFMHSNQEVRGGTAAEMDMILCDLMPILYGGPSSTLAGVLEIVRRYVSGRDY